MTIGIIFLACMGFTLGFLVADIKHADVDTETVRVVSKYAPGTTKYGNLFWQLDHTSLGLVVKLYDGSVECVGVSSELWGSTMINDRCKLQIRRGSITGIIWDYKIVGKTY
jgi:hypothetical protein